MGRAVRRHRMLMKTRTIFNSFILAGVLLAAPAVFAHCDTLSGPVVSDAREAIERKEVTPVLKWIRAADEPEIREAFARTIEVRDASPAAASLADEFFFSTLVRVHRAGEGAPFTGLKEGAPATIEQAADRALETGDISDLAAELAESLRVQITEKAAATRDLRKHADHNVEAGRAYVAAYVDYVHFVEAAAKLIAADPAAGHAEHAH